MTTWAAVPSIPRRVQYALDHDKVRVHFQPQRPLVVAPIAGDGAPYTIEALVRIASKDGLIGPDLFLPAIEHTPLMIVLGRRALTLAVDGWRDFRDRTGTACRLAVNASAVELDGGYVDFLALVLADRGMEASDLTVEITETTTTVPCAEGQLARLRDLGVHISIDDFGAGWSNLARIRDLQFDQLKTDRSLLMTRDGAPSATQRDEYILAALGNLARTLDVQLVLEGIETPSQLDIARRVGADYAQGFLLGRPVPSEELGLAVVDVTLAS